MSKSHQWINREREKLRKKYPEKIILVYESKVVKTFDTPVSLHNIYREADKICKDKDGDWSWAYIASTEERMIL